MRLILAALLLLLPCAALADTTPQGNHYTLYLDHPAPPCGPLQDNEGCYVDRSTGEKEVYVTSKAPQWVLDHELAHVDGMRHSSWRDTPRGLCAFVIRSGGKYARGDTICNKPTGETVFPPDISV